MRSSLSICIFHVSGLLAQSLLNALEGVFPGEKMQAHYSITQFSTCQALLDYIKQGAHHIDCLILQETPDLPSLLHQLQQQEVLFPTVIVQSDQASPQFISDSSNNSPNAALLSGAYHAAMLSLTMEQLSHIGVAIDQAISKFIQLSLAHQPSELASTQSVEFLETRSLSLKAQQVRLAEKLKERLGYLGVYYKRNPQNFLRHMTPSEREELLRQLKDEYREIILTYFSAETDLNQKIDNFVNVAFFADVPVAQVVEIHMNLMDEFSKQLKLEGRNDEVLQDYRLTLIDTIAHLCEMYRRSIPRES